MLLKMLEWKVGFETGFSLSIGKMQNFWIAMLIKIRGKGFWRRIRQLIISGYGTVCLRCGSCLKRQQQQLLNI